MHLLFLSRLNADGLWSDFQRGNDRSKLGIRKYRTENNVSLGLTLGDRFFHAPYNVVCVFLISV
jgi:hypothetical protein